MVTADGDVLSVSADELPDLFWAVRGGGGNFGVATAFEFRLHEVGPMAQLGLFFWGIDQGEAPLKFARELLWRLPDEMGVFFAGMSAPPEPFVPEEHHLAHGFAVFVVSFTASDELSSLVAVNRRDAPTALPVRDTDPVCRTAEDSGRVTGVGQLRRTRRASTSTTSQMRPSPRWLSISRRRLHRHQ